MATDTHAQGRERPALFVWLELLAVAVARREVSGVTAGVGILIASQSRGTTGENATIDAAAIGDRTGLSTATVWRHVKRLTSDSWLIQTRTPTRGSNGERGRRARYRLGTEAEIYPDLSAIALADRVADPRSEVRADSRVADPGGTMRDDQRFVSHFDPNRVAESAESSLTTDREDAPLTPSDGSPTAGSPSHERPATHVQRARDIAAAGVEECRQVIVEAARRAAAS